VTLAAQGAIYAWCVGFRALGATRQLLQLRALVGPLVLVLVAAGATHSAVAAAWGFAVASGFGACYAARTFASVKAHGTNEAEAEEIRTVSTPRPRLPVAEADRVGSVSPERRK
jgi:hypothetical protein